MNARPAAAAVQYPASEAADSTACLRCGVCCYSHLETYVRVTGDDWTRLGPDADRHAHFIGHRAYLRMSEGHCAALETRPDPDHPGVVQHVCTIYERRPQICRDLARGSPECEGELALKADRVAGR
ncbi:MAG: YkgJ family cysteine cluster protein [Burkholderiales bacterium]|nr:YkgJ family cysteine cluster protein [Opitutaceae bacterium]